MLTTFRILLAVLALCCGAASSEEIHHKAVNFEQIRLTAESEPLLTAAGCVNILSGDFFQTASNPILVAGEPVVFTSFYDSGHHRASSLGFGIGSAFPGKLYYHRKKKHRNVYLEQREGLTIPFTLEKKKSGTLQGRISTVIFDHGYTNTTESLLRGEPSYSETKISRLDDGEWIVELSDGTKRFYQDRLIYPDYSTSYLKREIKPNGIQKVFEYDKHKLSKISIVNRDDTLELGSLDFTYDKAVTSITASNGERIVYRHKKGRGWFREGGTKVSGEFPVCRSIETSASPKVNFYTPFTQASQKYNSLKIHKILYPEGRYLKIEYDNQGRVAKLIAPFETGKAPKTCYSFDYQSKKTVVEDALGNQSVYRFKNNRLTQVVQSGQKKLQYFWNKKGRLLAKKLGDIAGPPIIHKAYTYDRSGNPVKIAETGTITGEGKQTRETTYSYSKDGFNLPLKEGRPNGEEIVFTYLPGTNLLTKKLHYAQGKCRLRHFYKYDSNSLVVEEMKDDGSAADPDDLSDVTYRTITRIDYQLDPNFSGFTLPIRKEESSLDGPLKTTEYVYNTANLLAEKRLYDSEGQLAGTWYFAYNDQKKLIRETDPLGRVILYDYDTNGNKIYEEKVGSGKNIKYAYDLGNRLIEVKRTTLEDTLSTRYTYDPLGNCLSETDSYGNTTTYQYDSLGRQVLETDPDGHSIATKYNLLDQPVRIVDKEGNQKEISYTIDNHPVHIQYPDGTAESFEYDISGYLQVKYESDGSSTHYTRDFMGRALTEKRYSPSMEPLASKTYRYKGENLVYEEDERNIATIYDYDGAGRLIAKTRGNIQEQYRYDTLGRLSKTIKGSQVKVKEYDVLDRVVEERIEDLSGNPFRKVQYSYDRNDNVISSRTFYSANAYSEAKTRYNPFGLPVEAIDPEGNKTTYSYKHKGRFERWIEDPLGRVVHQVYDNQNRVKTETVTYNGKKFDETNYTYSPNGNLIKEERIGLVIERTFDPQGRLQTLEENNRVTRYTYRHGLLETLAQPNGIILTYAYDFQKRLVRKTSSDGTIDYTYSYDPAGNLVEARGGGVTLRKYDENNHMVEETLEHGATLQYEYDAIGRPTRLVLPDRTSVDYTYNPADLVNIERHGQVHTCEYDLAGNLHAETCFNGAEIRYHYDKNQRILSVSSPHYTQNQEYDPAGNLIFLTVNQQESSFQYDPLNQLTKDRSTIYSYDSIYNRTAVNGISYSYKDNLPLSDGKRTYTYDANGNRLSKGSSKYCYDALNRLVEADGIEYIYDALDRLISRKQQNKEDFFYFKDTEIGTEELLRILGSDTIAVERQGKLLPTIRNHRGSVTVVMNPEQDAIGQVEYSAFGKKSSDSAFFLPWQFFGQRTDPDTGYVHYLKRVYDPEMGRWLTPDPLGFADGPNPFAFLKNNPWTHIDPDGQFAFALPLLTFGSGLTLTSLSTAAYYTGAVALTAAAYWSGTRFMKAIGEAQLANEIANLGNEMYVSAPRPVEKPSKQNTNEQQKDNKQPPDKQAAKLPDCNRRGKQQAFLNESKGQIWSSTKKEGPAQNAYNHWKRHGSEFSELNNAKQYVEKARGLFNDPLPLKRIRSDGAVLRYDPLSNTFGSYSSAGVPKTLFKPGVSRSLPSRYSTPLEYFYGQ